MKKFNLIIGLIFSALVLSSCSTDYSLSSTKTICIGYLNAGPLSIYKGARKAELDKRGVSTCGPYEAEAEAVKRRKSADTGEAFERLSKTLRDAQKSLPCTLWTFTNGVKQCLD